MTPRLFGVGLFTVAPPDGKLGRGLSSSNNMKIREFS